MEEAGEKRKGSKFTDKELVDMDSLVMARKIDKESIEGFIKAVSDYAAYGRELENSLKEQMPELGDKLLKISNDAFDELYDLGEEWLEAEEQLRWLDESVTKFSLVDLLEALSGITLMTEEKEVKEIKRPMDYGGEDEYSERSRGGDFDGRGTRVWLLWHDVAH